MTDNLLSPQQLADYLGIPVKTVYTWRTNNVGPEGIKVGKHVRYRQSSVETWLNGQSDSASTGAA